MFFLPLRIIQLLILNEKIINWSSDTRRRYYGQRSAMSNIHTLP